MRPPETDPARPGRESALPATAPAIGKRVAEENAAAAGISNVQPEGLKAAVARLSAWWTGSCFGGGISAVIRFATTPVAPTPTRHVGIGSRGFAPRRRCGTPLRPPGQFFYPAGMPNAGAAHYDR